MIQALFKRLFHIPEMILVFTLTALACLPIALSELVRGAGMSLLLPLTLFGAILAWALAGSGVRRISSACILLILGPLALYIRIGQLGASLFNAVKQALLLIPAIFNGLLYRQPFDASLLISSENMLAQKVIVFSGRISLWFTNIFQGVRVEDPVVPTLIWSLALWLIAVWAGWQIYRNKRFMLGMLPSTVLLAVILDYTGKEKETLWIHLTLLLFLCGLTHYHNLQKNWDASGTDYAESTSLDTLVAVCVLALGLVFVSSMSSTVSIRDILDNFREKPAVTNQSQAKSPGQESVKDGFRFTGFKNGLPRSYLLSAGPEVSTQLAMTISTGDLPPMPQSAQPTAPRYYWRTLTYSIYTGVGWTNRSVPVEDVSADQALMTLTNSNYRTVHAEVIFPNDISERLYWTGTLVSADVPFKAAWLHKIKDGTPQDMDMFAALATVESYHAESLLLEVNAQELRDSPSVYPDWVRKQFLTLPDSVPERVLGLARDLTASEPTAYDRALAIQDYLREFPYTLDISAPPSDRDVVDYFLFDLKQGYCDYYATSMAVLARAAGLPARLVVGYANGSYDPERAQYIVTENYAHSWTEVYFSGIGWVEFEPTASQSVISYEEENESPVPVVESLPADQPLGGKSAFFFQKIFANAWLPALLILACGFLWLGIDSFRLRRIEPSRTIQILYKRLRRLARPVTGQSSRNQTAHSYAFALIQRLSTLKISPRLQNWLAPAYKEIEQLTELFSRSLFAPLPPTRVDANAALRVWSRLRWRLIFANMLRAIKK